MQLAKERVPTPKTALARPKHPPGPKGHWFFGSLKQITTDPLPFYTGAWKTYGDYVRARAFPGIYFYLVAHPDAVEHILQKNNRNYRKPDPFFNKPMRLLAGDGLITAEGELWRTQRKLATPAFQPQHVRKLAPVVTRAAEALAATWSAKEPGRTTEILDEMMRLALRVASTAFFSMDISGEFDEIGLAFRDGFGHVRKRMNSPTMPPSWVPTAENRQFKRAMGTLNRVVLEIITRRRREPREQQQGPRDVLALLLAAQDETTGVGMSDVQLKDEVLGLLAAGHETIGAALAWTWYLLAAHPEIQESLHDELHGRLRGATPTADDLDHLPLNRAVFEESMRLYPPAWGVPREAIADDVINGYTIKRKTPIVVSQYLTHRHPDFWSDPERFDPGRFLGECSAADRHRFAYYPFGGGPRLCIGHAFAMVEGPLILATLAQQFRVELVPGQTIIPDPTFTLRPKEGVKVRVFPR